jgi:hypothetical protein
MTDNIEQTVPETPTGSPEASETPTSDPVLEELLSKKVQESLQPIKEKLDNAFKMRDEALAKVAEFEKKEREAEKARLKEAGKLTELFEMQLAEERAAREAAEKQNVQLTRDISVKSILATLDFRNEKSREMAYKEIVEQLVRNEQGEWVHRSGINVRDYVKAYAEQEDNSFLFRPKVSSGSGGSSPSTSSSTSSKQKSLFEMSQEEVLQLAMEGKLPSSL